MLEILSVLKFLSLSLFLSSSLSLYLSLSVSLFLCISLSVYHSPLSPLAHTEKAGDGGQS